MEDNTEHKIRRFLFNKYAITLYVFLLIFLFVGEQSWVKQLARKREINKIQNEIEQIQRTTNEQKDLLNSLDNVDSLERFARENYDMHAPGETIYEVE